MTLSVATLSTQLQTLTPTSDAASAKLAFAQAYGNYMKDAIAALIPIIDAYVDSSGVPKIAAGLVLPGGGSTSSAAAAIESALFSFWFDVTVSPGLYFATATAATVPPTLVALNTALESVMNANLSNKRSLADAADAMATVIHSASAGATITIVAISGIPIT